MRNANRTGTRVAHNASAACALAFALACSTTMGGSPTGNGSTAGSGPSSGSSGGASSQTSGGAGGSAATSSGGMSLGGSGSASGGTGATHAAGGGGTGAVPLFTNPPPYEPAPAMLRRLTRTQFKNAVRDVFGADVDTTQLDADSWDDNFAVVGAASVVTSELGVEQYQTAIENAVDVVFADSAAAAKFIGCTPTGTADDACIRGFIQGVGLRAWRRPLETTEVDRLASLAASTTTTLGSALDGARFATVALFTSPSFLYRPELGTQAANGAWRLTSYEMAARLAFLVWNSLPDQTLLEQAASGALATADGLRAALDRMLHAPAGREAASAFAEEFMRLDRIATQAKDPKLFPDYATALEQGMVRDVRDTWAVVAFDDRGSMLDLFATPKVVVNQELASLYGLDTSGLTSTTFEVRTLAEDGPRLGLLSKAGFLSEFANQKEGSPTLRGRFIREQLLCTSIQPPPPNVNLLLPDPPADTPMTKRQRLELHRTVPTCAGCHELMDPLGLPLENFDAVGQYRTTDDGLPIDPSGDFDGAAVADARELGVTVSRSAEVGRCLVRRYYAYAMGHAERDVDGSVLNTLAAASEASGFKFRELVLAVATHDAFSTVTPPP